MTSLSPLPLPPVSKSLSHPKYRADIDGLRAIAVLSVVAFHAFPAWMPGGFIGVDIFFVISGFLISSIIFSSLNRNAFSFSEFYARRIKRIFPALLLVLVSSYIFGWFTLYPDEYKQLGKHVTGGASFLSNFILWNESGYFDTSAEVKPLLHLWSLGIEEQFYIFWPILLWLAWKARLNILTLTIASIAVSFTWNIRHISSDAVATFYMPHARIWELLIGSILAYTQLRYKNLFPIISVFMEKTLGRLIFSKLPASREAFTKNSASLSGAIILGYGFYRITSETRFPGWWAILPALGAALIISAGPGAWINRRVLSQRPLVWIGLISFPLYLWHWPILSFARIIESELPSREIRIAAVLLSLVLAWITYLLIEKPLRKNKSGLKTPVLVLIMAVIAGTGYVTFKYDGLPDRASVKSAAEFNSQFVGPIWKYTKNDICINRYPFKEAESYGWWFCIANKNENPTLLLLGNSFANHLFPGLASEKETKGNSILSIGACPPDMADITDPNAPTNTSPCSGNRSYHQKLLINNIIENSKSIRYSIIDGLDQKVTDAYIGKIDDRISFLEKNNIKIIVFIPHIIVNHDLKGCYSRPLKTTAADCELGIDAKKAIDDGFAPLITKISAAHPNVKFFDQNQLFCGLWKCSLTLNGMPLFRDQYNHYSEYASTEVAKLFIKWAKINTPDLLLN